MGLYKTQSSTVEGSSQEIWALRQRISLLEKELRDRDTELNTRCEHERELMDRIHSLEEEIAELQPKNTIGTPKKYIKKAKSTSELLYPKINMDFDDPIIDAKWEDFMQVQIKDFINPQIIRNIILYRDVIDKVWRDIGDEYNIRIPYPITKSKMENCGIINYAPASENDLNNFEKQFK